MLTPMGMRQRYLLGKYNALYGDTADRKNAPFLGSKNLLIESTDINRTVQSAYAEMSGYYFDLLDKVPEVSFSSLMNLQRTFPPMKIRRDLNIIAKLR